MRREVALTVEQDPGKDQEGGKEGRRMPSPESSPEWTTFTKEPTCIFRESKVVACSRNENAISGQCSDAGSQFRRAKQ